MKKLLLVIFVSILILGCSKNQNLEFHRHVVFTSYDSGVGLFKLELTDGEHKIEYTLKCLAGVSKDMAGAEEKNDNCYYSVGDSMDENSLLESDREGKANFHFLTGQNSFSIREVRVYEIEKQKTKLELTSLYQVVSAKIVESKK